jgi:hypothetical protein
MANRNLYRRQTSYLSQSRTFFIFFLFQKISVIPLVCLSAILSVCLLVCLSSCHSIVCSHLSDVPPTVSCLLLSCLRVCQPAVLPGCLSVMPLVCLSVILSIHRLLTSLCYSPSNLWLSNLPLCLHSILPQYYGQACF